MAEIDGGHFCSSSIQKKVTSHASCGGAEDSSDPKFRDYSCERGSYSKSRERKRDRERYKDKDMMMDKERDNNDEKDKRDHRRSQRDHHRVCSDRRQQCGRNREDGDHHKYGFDHDSRRRCYDDRESDEERHRHSSCRSRLGSKRIRVSGFDVVAPPSFNGAAAPLPTIPGAYPNNMTQQAARHARRVYVGGLSPITDEQSVATFFSQVMSAIGGNTAGPGDDVVNVYINHEKKFSFVEMRSVEEASNAMALDGIIFEGAPVKVRRHRDYNPSLAAAPDQVNQGPTSGLEGSDRKFVGGLRYYFTEVQIRDLLESFGPLRGFDLVKDRVTGNSIGYAFCVYQDTSTMDLVCASLNGIILGEKTLTVRCANLGTTIQPKPEHENARLPSWCPSHQGCRLPLVVSADELKDDEEYNDILEDMDFALF
ncbi:hypothetical protein MKX01_042523 [Papaver californicum]|nr:hypothetical protein MKX01_042523 [Papaver californicum]